jgi:hypothetical protein
MHDVWISAASAAVSTKTQVSAFGFFHPVLALFGFRIGANKPRSVSVALSANFFLSRGLVLLSGVRAIGLVGRSE